MNERRAEPLKQIRHACNRPRIFEEQGGANQLGVIGVNDNVVGNARQLRPGHGDTAVAGTIAHLVEPVGQVLAKRLPRDHPKNPALTLRQFRLILDLPASPGRHDSRVPAMM